MVVGAETSLSLFGPCRPSCNAATFPGGPSSQAGGPGSSAAGPGGGEEEDAIVVKGSYGTKVSMPGVGLRRVTWHVLPLWGKDAVE